jgi:endonuclease/exonuclease/phosphatase family metal-dependent hydrolase
LDHRGSEARLNGIKLVYESMEANRRERGLPAVLTGDMNCTPDSEPIRFLRGELEAGHRRSDLKDAFTKAAQPVGRTYNGFKGVEDGEPIDYIFVSPDVEVIGTVVDRSQYGGGYPSDHYPVAADLKI